MSLTTTENDAQVHDVSPYLALQVRLAHLEALIGPSAASSQPILLRALAVKRNLDAAVASHSSLRNFARDFDANRRWLDPGFKYDARSSSDPSRPSRPLTLDLLNGADHGREEDRKEAILTTQEQILVVLDAEKDMRALDRLLTECEVLDKRGVAGAGQMAEYERLQPLLYECRQRYQTDLAPTQNDLEETLLRLLERYQLQVDSLSRIFIAWDEALKEMEGKVGAMERDKKKGGG